MHIRIINIVIREEEWKQEFMACFVKENEEVQPVNEIGNDTEIENEEANVENDHMLRFEYATNGQRGGSNVIEFLMKKNKDLENRQQMMAKQNNEMYTMLREIHDVIIVNQREDNDRAPLEPNQPASSERININNTIQEEVHLM